MPSGGFASSLDADTDHEEGLTYVWSWAELEQALGKDVGRFAEVYGATPDGNWEGKIILNRLAPASFGWLGDEREGELAAWRAKLLAIRNKRPQPTRDDKVLADWNGLTISGLARAAQAIGSMEAERHAADAFRFVRDSMEYSDGRLAHSSMDGELVKPGVATDYANMIRGALDLFARHRQGRLSECRIALVHQRAAASFRFRIGNLPPGGRRRDDPLRPDRVPGRRSDTCRDRHHGFQRGDALHADRRYGLPRACRTYLSERFRIAPKTILSAAPACNPASIRCSASAWRLSSGPVRRPTRWQGRRLARRTLPCSSPTSIRRRSRPAIRPKASGQETPRRRFSSAMRRAACRRLPKQRRLTRHCVKRVPAWPSGTCR